ncbi:MAG TPA: hypothetical protein VGK67_30835 [Myxococcales bacterium]|jgi:hypothetical protein
MHVALIAMVLLAGPAKPGKAFIDLDAKIVAAAGLKAKAYELVEVGNENGRLQADPNGVPADEPPPAWATGAMRKDWEAGTAACRAKLGPKPQSGDVKALFCAKDLANALWQRHLERLDPKGIVIGGGFLEMEDEEQAKTFPVSIYGYRVDEARVRTLAGKAKSKDEALKMAANFVNQIIDGKGEAKPREIVRSLPVASGKEPRTEVAQFKAVEMPAGCSPVLPKRLELTSENPKVAANLDRLYGLSVRDGMAANRECTFEYAAESGDSIGPVFKAEGKLSCEGRTFESKQMALKVSAVEEAVLSDLLTKAFREWCGGK